MCIQNREKIMKLSYARHYWKVFAKNENGNLFPVRKDARCRWGQSVRMNGMLTRAAKPHIRFEDAKRHSFQCFLTKQIAQIFANEMFDALSSYEQENIVFVVRKVSAPRGALVQFGNADNTGCSIEGRRAVRISKGKVLKRG